MDARQAFKAGFLARCVDAGMTFPQIKQAAERLAAHFEKQANPLEKYFVDTPIAMGKSLMGWGLPLMLAAPWLAGAGGGYLAGKATDIGDQDIREVQDNEVLDEYRRQTSRLQQRRAARDFLQSQVAAQPRPRLSITSASPV